MQSPDVMTYIYKPACGIMRDSGILSGLQSIAAIRAARQTSRDVHMFRVGLRSGMSRPHCIKRAAVGMHYMLMFKAARNGSSAATRRNLIK